MSQRGVEDGCKYGCDETEGDQPPEDLGVVDAHGGSVEHHQQHQSHGRDEVPQTPVRQRQPQQVVALDKK